MLCLRYPWLYFLWRDVHLESTPYSVSTAHTFTKRPSSPRYHCVWDVVIVLKTKYLKTLHPIRGLHLRDLTLKITMLIALLSGQRCQTIHALDINDMQVVYHPNQQYVFQINKLLKTSRPGKHFSHLTLQAYPADEHLCIFKTI